MKNKRIEMKIIDVISHIIHENDFIHKRFHFMSAENSKRRDGKGNGRRREREKSMSQIRNMKKHNRQKK